MEPELIEIPRAVFTASLWALSWADLRAKAAQGEHGMRVWTPRGSVYRETWHDRLRQSYSLEEDGRPFTQYEWIAPDVALMREGDSVFAGRPVLYGQNW